MGPTMDLEGLVRAYTLDHLRWQKHEAMAARVTEAFASTPPSTGACEHEDVTINALLVMHRILKSHMEPNVQRYNRRLILACDEDFYFENDTHKVRYRYALNVDIGQVALFTPEDIADLKKAGVLWDTKTWMLYFYEHRSITGI